MSSLTIKQALIDIKAKLDVIEEVNNGSTVLQDVTKVEVKSIVKLVEFTNSNDYLVIKRDETRTSPFLIQSIKNPFLTSWYPEDELRVVGTYGESK